MKIIELTELQFKNYSKIHSMRNYFQTIEYADFEKENGYNKLLLGLIDDNNNLCAATLILLKELKGKYKVGIVPNGYLINYNNSNLFEDFTKELKKYGDEGNEIACREVQSSEVSHYTEPYTYQNKLRERISMMLYSIEHPEKDSDEIEK